MNDIQIFNSPEFGEIRTVMIEGEAWFVGNDIARVLGYAKPKGAVQNHVDSEDKQVAPIQGPAGEVGMTVVNESGMYALIFGSKLESAKRFKKWVTSEVLPTIHRTGQYGQARLPMTIPEQIQLIAQGHVELKAEIDSVKEDLEQFKMNMPILGIEIDRITEAVHKRGVDAMGGKGSNAYNDRSLRGRVYSDIYRELKRQFGVTTYKAIRRNQCELAISVIDEYELPFVLAEAISDCNAQIGMGVA